MRSVLFSALMAAIVASGCFGFGGDVTDNYQDATQRYTNSVTGGATETRTVNIPSGTEQLTVALAYDVSGGYTFELFNPAGIQVNDEAGGGDNHVENSGWYSTQDPIPGNWRLEVSIGGSGAYAVGFYYS